MASTRASDRPTMPAVMPAAGHLDEVRQVGSTSASSTSFWDSARSSPGIDPTPVARVTTVAAIVAEPTTRVPS